MAQSWPRENPLETRCKDNFPSLSASISSTTWCDRSRVLWFSYGMFAIKIDGFFGCSSHLVIWYFKDVDPLWFRFCSTIMTCSSEAPPLRTNLEVASTFIYIYIPGPKKGIDPILNHLGVYPNQYFGGSHRPNSPKISPSPKRKGGSSFWRSPNMGYTVYP